MSSARGICDPELDGGCGSQVAAEGVADELDVFSEGVHDAFVVRPPAGGVEVGVGGGAVVEFDAAAPEFAFKGVFHPLHVVVGGDDDGRGEAVLQHQFAGEDRVFVSAVGPVLQDDGVVGDAQLGGVVGHEGGDGGGVVGRAAGDDERGGPAGVVEGGAVGGARAAVPGQDDDDVGGAGRLVEDQEAAGGEDGLNRQAQHDGGDDQYGDEASLLHSAPVRRQWRLPCFGRGRVGPQKFKKLSLGSGH